MFLNTELWLRALLAIAVGFAVSFASTPIVKTFAQKVGAIDVPKDARRVHDHPIPRMGGLAIFLGFILSVVLFADITRQVQRHPARAPSSSSPAAPLTTSSRCGPG